MGDRQDPEYWYTIKEGDFLTLTDYQSIAQAGSGGKDYRVVSIRTVAIPDKDSAKDLAEYRFLELQTDENQMLYFVIVRVSGEFELRVYYLPKGFVAGTRDQLVDLGHTWFFLPPPNPEDFLSADLEYAPYPDLPPIEENGTQVQREYEPGGFGQPIYGSYRKGRDEVPVIIVEYSTGDEQALNPLILILEERWMLPDGTIPQEGGLVIPLFGCTVMPESVETYPGS